MALPLFVYLAYVHRKKKAVWQNCIPSLVLPDPIDRAMNALAIRVMSRLALPVRDFSMEHEHLRSLGNTAS